MRMLFSMCSEIESQPVEGKGLRIAPLKAGRAASTETCEVKDRSPGLCRSLSLAALVFEDGTTSCLRRVYNEIEKQ